MNELFLLVVCFIMCQIFVKKSNKITQFLNQTSPGKILFLGIIVIGVLLAITILFKFSWIIVGFITIFEGSIISEKYRLVFEKMEKGKS